MQDKIKKIIGIDLFCGIGGMTNGLVQSGINIVSGYDIDNSCKTSFSQKLNNNPEFICDDITSLDETEFTRHFIDKKKYDYSMVVGCAPCQPYSSYQKKKTFEYRSLHKSYGLILQYLRVVKAVMPDFVIMENVRNLINDPYFNDIFLDFFKKNDYHIDYKIIDMANYGAPQRRKRLLFLAVNKKNVKNYSEFKIPEKNKNLNNNNVVDVIGNLPKISAGEVCKTDYFHRASNLSEINLKRIENSIEGGTWKDWPKELLPKCYLKETGKTFTSVYGRIKRDSVAPTLTTQFNRYGTGRYGHYEQNRALSIREGSLLQTFPLEYEFDKNLGSTVLARQIGNAVPPIFSKILGEMIIQKVK